MERGLKIKVETELGQIISSGESLREQVATPYPPPPARAADAKRAVQDPELGGEPDSPSSSNPDGHTVPINNNNNYYNSSSSTSSGNINSSFRGNAGAGARDVNISGRGDSAIIQKLTAELQTSEQLRQQVSLYRLYHLYRSYRSYLSCLSQ